MSALNQFGAVFSFAIDMETQIAAYYEALGDSVRAAAADKRREKLERTRREQVLEITLEPIEGLDGDDFALDTGDTSAAGQAAVAKTAAAFYAAAAPKINVRQAQRILERCGREYE